MSRREQGKRYEKVVQANIDLHSRLADSYDTCEPHFRGENVKKVEEILVRQIRETNATKLLDLGCGTGFIINIAKKHLKKIHGVDVTQAMLDRVDTSGPAEIELSRGDTGTFPVEEGVFDLVSAYSFLHHLYDIRPTLKTAHRALRPGGRFYADLEPNSYFWSSINSLDKNEEYDPVVRREIDMLMYRNEQAAAEYGKNVLGGFQEELLREHLLETGFSNVEVQYHWFIGQGSLINDERFETDERFRNAEVIHGMLQKCLPLSRSLFKYLGFVATK